MTSDEGRKRHRSYARKDEGVASTVRERNKMGGNVGVGRVATVGDEDDLRPSPRRRHVSADR